MCADPNRLPYSDISENGYDNIIAGIVADELNAELHFVWTSFNRWGVVLSDFLYVGECDIIFGLQDGEEGVLASTAYYRSPYAFVFRSDAGFRIDSFDNQDLARLRIGVQAAPAEAALRQRGIKQNVTSWATMTSYDHEKWLGDIIRAVSDGEIDVAIVWSPIAGYFLRDYGNDLEMVLVPNEVEPPFIYLVRPITAVVRPGDEALRDAVDLAFALRWQDIQGTLDAFGVPRSNLPRPITTLETVR